MKNLAGKEHSHADLLAELEAAKLEAIPNDDPTDHPEVYRYFRGEIHGWTFQRSWYYWSAGGPPLPFKYAMPLHELIGDEVRVDGHCGCPSPVEWYGKTGKGVTAYHIDTQEGLNILVATICKWVRDAEEEAWNIHRHIGYAICRFLRMAVHGKDHWKVGS